jgi:hypothetical protein
LRAPPAFDPPHRFAMTRRYDWDHPTLGRRITRVSYRFTPTKEGARVIVRHRDFGSADAASEHAVGWERTLDLLCAYLAHDPASGETAPIDAVEIDIGDDVSAMSRSFGRSSGTRASRSVCSPVSRLKRPTNPRSRLRSARRSFRPGWNRAVLCSAWTRPSALGPIHSVRTLAEPRRPRIASAR